MRAIAVAALLAILALAGCLGDSSASDDEGACQEDCDDGAADGGDFADPGTNDTDGNGTGDNGTVPPAQNPPQNQTNVTAWEWPDMDDATIRPGVQMVASGAQCTSNFVFLDPFNSTVYLGFAAHCVADGEATDTDGCDADAVEPLPLGTKVEVEGASKKATLVYSSWDTMQQVGESGGNTCPYNDFAVVELDPADRGKAHPAMLGFGGPTETSDFGSTDVGAKVLTFGNTGLRPGPPEIDAREGYIISKSGQWSYGVYTVTPGLPGDSGSAVILADGPALGILVTVSATGSNGITDLTRATDYAMEHAGYDFRLATWDVLDGGMLPS